MPDYSKSLLEGAAIQPGRPSTRGGSSYSDALLGVDLVGPPQTADQGPGFFSRATGAVGRTLRDVATPLPLIEDVRDIFNEGFSSSEQFPYFRLPESVGKRRERTSQSARDIAPFMLGGPVGGALRAGGGAVARRVAGEAAAAGIADAGKQVIERGRINPVDVATSAGFGAAGAGIGEAAGRGLNTYLNRMVVPDVDRVDPSAVANLQRLSSQHGIQLTPAELTDLPSLKAQQKMLGNIPASSDDLARFQRMRADEQIEPAIARYLDSISDFQGDEAAGELTRAAANRAQETVARIRADQARPLYEQAFAEAAPVDISGPLNAINRQSRRFPEGGRVNQGLNAVRRLLGNYDDAGNFIPDRSMARLHGAKVEIDQILTGIDPETRVGPQTAAAIRDVRSSLLDALDEASPVYADARAVFADLSPGVERVREGVAGTIADLPDQQLRSVAARLFDKSKISPRSAVEARKQLQAADPQAWQAIKRSYLEDAWVKASQEGLTSGGTPVSAGAKFRKSLFGNSRQLQILQGVLEPTEMRTLNELSQVLEASARVKPIGSDTAWNQQMMQAMKRDGKGNISRMIGAMNPNVLRDVSAFMDERGLEQSARRMVEMVTSPDGMQFMRELKQASPNNRFRAAVIGYALGLGTEQETFADEAPAQPPVDAPAGEQGAGAGVETVDPVEALLADPSAADPQTLQTMALAEIVKSLRGQQALAGQAQEAAGDDPELMARMEAVEQQRAQMAEQIQALQQAGQASGQQTAAMAALAEDQQALLDRQAAAIEESAAVEQALPEPKQTGGKQWTRKSATPKRDDQGLIVSVEIVEEDEDGNLRTKIAKVSRDDFGRMTGLNVEKGGGS